MGPDGGCTHNDSITVEETRANVSVPLVTSNKPASRASSHTVINAVVSSTYLITYATTAEMVLGQEISQALPSESMNRASRGHMTLPLPQRSHSELSLFLTPKRCIVKYLGIKF